MEIAKHFSKTMSLFLVFIVILASDPLVAKSASDAGRSV